MQDWMKSTTINPIGLTILIVLAIAVLMVKRRYAPLPFLIMACFVAPGQNIMVGSFSFYLIRTLAYVATVRCFIRGEYKGFRWNKIDYAVLAFAIVGTTIYTIQHGSDGLKTKTGHLSDSILVYFLARCFFRDISDVRRFAFTAIFIAIPLVGFFAVESSTGRNMFSYFGGVDLYSEVRQGKLRAQGPFAHSILAGCFFACLIPLMALIWFKGGVRRWLAVVGVCCGLALIVMCNSSTPIGGVVAAGIGALLFKVKQYMRVFRWGVVALLFGLHMVMQAPVWSLIQRIDIIGGSTGNFRYRLIDGAIQNYHTWWLFGTDNPGAWGWGLQDVTNQFIAEGVNGGLLSMLIFMSIFGFAFGHIGRLWRATPNQQERMFYWALGIALAVHCTNFMGVTYFGQIVTLLWIQIAMVASLQPLSKRQRLIMLQRRRALATARQRRRPVRPLQPTSQPAALPLPAKQITPNAV